MQTQKINIPLNGKTLSLHQLTGQSAHDVLVEMKRLSGCEDRLVYSPAKVGYADIKKLSSYYVMTPSIEGVHGIMMFTKLYGAEIVLLIDNHLNVFQIPLENIPSELFKGSLIDGVLTVSKKGVTTFVRSDAWFVAGIDVSALWMAMRINQMRACFQGFKSHTKDLVKFVDRDWPLPESANVGPRLKKVWDEYHTKGYIMTHITSGPDADLFEVENPLAEAIIKTATAASWYYG
jgi:hypothetical protein